MGDWRPWVGAVVAAASIGVGCAGEGPVSGHAAALERLELALERTGSAADLEAAGGLLIEAEGVKNAGAEYQGYHPDSLSPGPFREVLAFRSETGAPSGTTVGYEYRHDRFDGTYERIRERYDAGGGRVIFVLDQGFAVHLRSSDDDVARRRLLRRHPGLLLEEVRARAAGLRWLGVEAGLEWVSASLEGGEVVDLGFDETGMVRAVRYLTDAPGFGDTEVRWRFDDYRDVPGLGSLPHAYGVSLNDRPFTDMRITRLAVGGGAAAELLAAPEGIRIPEPQVIEPGANPSSQARVREVAPGVYMVVQLRGGFHPMFVEMDDYVVAVDAPAGYPLFDELPASDVAPGPTASWLTDRYVQLIREAVPDKPIRYVVITHFHNDHAGGVRSFVAEGATVLAAPPAADPIRRLVRAPHTLAPDRLSREGGTLELEVVDGQHTVTDGRRTVEVIDVGPNPHTAAMLVVRLVEDDVWFVSDLLDPTRVDRFPKPEHAALDRWFASWLESRGYAPERIYTMHGSGLVTPEHLEKLGGGGG